MSGRRNNSVFNTSAYRLFCIYAVWGYSRYLEQSGNKLGNPPNKLSSQSRLVGNDNFFSLRALEFPVDNWAFHMRAEYLCAANPALTGLNVKRGLFYCLNCSGHCSSQKRHRSVRKQRIRHYLQAIWSSVHRVCSAAAMKTGNYIFAVAIHNLTYAIILGKNSLVYP